MKTNPKYPKRYALAITLMAALLLAVSSPAASTEQTNYSLTVELHNLAWLGESGSLAAVLTVANQTTSRNLGVTTHQQINASWSGFKLDLPSQFNLQLASSNSTVLTLEGTLDSPQVLVSSHQYDPTKLQVLQGDLLTVRLDGMFLLVTATVPATGIAAQATVRNQTYQSQVTSAGTTSTITVGQIPLAASSATLSLRLLAKNVTVALMTGVINRTKLDSISMTGLLEEASISVQVIRGFSTSAVPTTVLEGFAFQPSGQVVSSYLVTISSSTSVEGTVAVNLRAVDEAGKPLSNVSFTVDIPRYNLTTTLAGLNATLRAFPGDVAIVKASSEGYSPATANATITQNTTQIVLTLRSLNRPLLEQAEAVLTNPLFVPVAVSVIILALLIFSVRRRGT